MNKNIIICADGTGNRGGVGRGTNVWRIFNALDTSNETREQVITYHDGVGTQKLKPLRLLAGAFGFGLSQNVRDLYKFLALNYRSGDHVYLFGFSRGAFTIRVLENVISMYGVPKNVLADTEAKTPERPFSSLSIKEIDSHVKEILKRYKDKIGSAEPSKNPEDIYGNVIQHQAVDTCVLGVWDTVNSVGFPGFLRALYWQWKPWCKDNTIDKAPMSASYAFHALAIDEERSPFNPRYWTGSPDNPSSENLPTPQSNVLQVWFAGMHSNVGGGYAKDGMAQTSLKWMVEELNRIPERDAPRITKDEIIRFEDTALNNIYNHANAHDHMYDSRRAFGRYYRYKPRNIFDIVNRNNRNYDQLSYVRDAYKKFNLIEKDLKKTTPTLKLPLVHESVVDRISRHTEGYYPTVIPHHFLEWKTSPSTKKVSIEAKHVIPEPPQNGQYVADAQHKMGVYKDSRGIAWWMLAIGTAFVSYLLLHDYIYQATKNFLSIFKANQIESLDKPEQTIAISTSISDAIMSWLLANPLLSIGLVAYFGLLFLSSIWNKKEMAEMGKNFWSKFHLIETSHVQADEEGTAIKRHSQPLDQKIIDATQTRFSRNLKRLSMGKSWLDKKLTGTDY